MPFTIQKNDKGEFCVYKKGDDGKPSGKTLGCHASKKNAVAQIGAVESEMKRQGKKSVDDLLSAGDLNLDELELPEIEISEPATINYIDVKTGETIWADTNITIDTSSSSTFYTKAESIDAYRNMIADAWYELDYYDIYIVEIFDEFVIVRDYKHKVYYKVKYSVSNDVVDFGKQNEWQDVRLQKEWVEKSLNLKERFNFERYISEEEQEEELDIDPRYAIKSLGGNRVGGYAVLWGDEDNKDLHEEYFTEETKDLKSIFDAVGILPFIVHHAMEDSIKSFVAGKVDVLEEDDVGMWWEATVKEFEAYRKYVTPLIENKMAYTSTGTLPAAKRVTKSGFISRWPIAEVTATWLPAEYRMLEHPISDIKSAYKEIGIEIDDKLNDYEDKKSEKTDNGNLGVEKARLKELVEQEFVKLKLLKIELGE